MEFLGRLYLCLWKGNCGFFLLIVVVIRLFLGIVICGGSRGFKNFICVDFGIVEECLFRAEFV